MLMGSRLSLDNMVLFTECREMGNKSAIGTGNEEEKGCTDGLCIDKLSNSLKHLFVCFPP